MILVIKELKDFVLAYNNTVDQQDKVMITKLVAYWILLILKKKTKKKKRLIAADLSKQKALDAYLRAIQQITFTGTVKTTAVIYYILEQ